MTPFLLLRRLILLLRLRTVPSVAMPPRMMPPMTCSAPLLTVAVSIVRVDRRRAAAALAHTVATIAVVIFAATGITIGGVALGVIVVAVVAVVAVSAVTVVFAVAMFRATLAIAAGSAPPCRWPVPRSHEGRSRRRRGTGPASRPRCTKPSRCTLTGCRLLFGLPLDIFVVLFRQFRRRPAARRPDKRHAASCRRLAKLTKLAAARGRRPLHPPSRATPNDATATASVTPLRACCTGRNGPETKLALGRRRHATRGQLFFGHVTVVHVFGVSAHATEKLPRAAMHRLVEAGAGAHGEAAGEEGKVRRVRKAGEEGG